MVVALKVFSISNSVFIRRLGMFFFGIFGRLDGGGDGWSFY